MNDRVEIKPSAIEGKGVFATSDIQKGEVITESHVVLLLHDEQLPEQLATLEFPWDDEHYALCISNAGSFFNHAKDANAQVHPNKAEQTQAFIAARDISEGEEITIYYNDEFEAFIQ